MSELKYLKIIRDIRDKNKDLYEKIKNIIEHPCSVYTDPETIKIISKQAKKDIPDNELVKGKNACLSFLAKEYRVLMSMFDQKGKIKTQHYFIFNNKE